MPMLTFVRRGQEVGGDAGLSTLAKAVELELAAKAGTKSVRFFVKVRSMLCQRALHAVLSFCNLRVASLPRRILGGQGRRQ